MTESEQGKATKHTVKILVNAYRGDIQREIAELLDAGWQLVGPVIVSASTYFATMVKKEEE